jgi:hypothetical protein
MGIADFLKESMLSTTDLGIFVIPARSKLGASAPQAVEAARSRVYGRLTRVRSCNLRAHDSYVAVNLAHREAKSCTVEKR